MQQDIEEKSTKLGKTQDDFDLKVNVGHLSKIEDAENDTSAVLTEKSFMFTLQQDGKSLNSLRHQAIASPFFVKRFEDDTSRYYEGEMHNDMKEGYGTQVLENGDKYEGQWRRDLKHGFGVLTL